jgi:hypothetical protein
MALKTAMRCKEKLAGRSGAAAKSFDDAGRSRFRVALGYGQSAWQQRCKRLKTGRLPARLRLVSSQIGSYQCRHNNES